MKIRRLITATVAIFAFLSLAHAYAESSSQTVKLKIEGMTCGMCEAKVKKQLSSLCKDLTIDREKGEGVCKYEPPATPDKIIQEANKTGFKTTAIK